MEPIFNGIMFFKFNNSVGAWFCLHDYVYNQKLTRKKLKELSIPLMKKLFWRGQTQDVIIEIYENYKQWYAILKKYKFNTKEILTSLEYRM